MKIIVAGGRSVVDYSIVKNAIVESGLEISEIVSGKAKGVDAFGERFAEENNIPVVGFPAQWKLYGRAAGPKRNEEMAKYADACIVIWDGKSKGSKSMIKNAKKHNLVVFQKIVNL